MVINYSDAIKVEVIPNGYILKYSWWVDTITPEGRLVFNKQKIRHATEVFEKTDTDEDNKVLIHLLYRIAEQLGQCDKYKPKICFEKNEDYDPTNY